MNYVANKTFYSKTKKSLECYVHIRNCYESLMSQAA